MIQIRSHQGLPRREKIFPLTEKKGVVRNQGVITVIKKSDGKVSHYLTDLKVVAALALTRRVISSLPACSAIFIAVNPSYNDNRKDKDA